MIFYFFYDYQEDISLSVTVLVVAIVIVTHKSFLIYLELIFCHLKQNVKAFQPHGPFTLASLYFILVAIFWRSSYCLEIFIACACWPSYQYF